MRFQAEWQGKEHKQMTIQQVTLENETVLDFKVRQSLDIIEKATKKAGLTPLIVNFSGGKDSTVLLDLTQKVTSRFICFYMVSGLEFPNTLSFVEKCCSRWSRKLYASYPSDYVTEKYPENGFFIRLERLGYFPKPKQTWCSVYLKIRPQVRKLRSLFGRQGFIKLNGVRRFESSRRMEIYRNTRKEGYMKVDSEDHKSLMVFPILDWLDEDVLLYLEREKIHVDLNPLYTKYGVSGCSWCAFYGAKIYKRVLQETPDYYDEFILWESRLDKPSVLGNVWMRDLKDGVGGTVN